MAIQDAVEELRTKIVHQNRYSSTTCQIRLDDAFLRRFIAVSRHTLEVLDESPQGPDISAALAVYNSYYDVILSIPKIKDVLRGSKFSYAADALVGFINTPKANPLQFYGFDSSNRVILGYSVVRVDPSRENVLLGNLLAAMVSVEWLYDMYGEKVEKNGMVMLMDHNGLSMSHFRVFLTNPTMLRIFTRFFTLGVPISIHQQGIMNEMSVTNLFYRLIKPLVDERLLKLMKFYGQNYDDVKSYLGGAEFTPDFVPGGQRREVAWPSNEVAIEYLRKVLPMVDAVELS